MPIPNKERWLVILLVLAVLIAFAAFKLSDLREGRRYALTIFTHSIGKELIVTTNSASLESIDSNFQTQLGELLAAPTGIAKVQLDDDRSPIDNEKADSRLILTNAVGKTLVIRLKKTPHKWRVLSFQPVM